MTTTRERALEAAVALVGEQGMRALTHARIDARAGLPSGSTSNSFRTRDALIEGLVTWIAEGERTDVPPYDRTDADAFIDALTHLVEVQTTDNALRTRARFTLFLGAPPEAAAPLRAQRALFEEWMASAATALGMRDPRAAARTLLACGSGLIMHRLTVDPGAPVRPVMERAVRGCLAA